MIYLKKLLGEAGAGLDSSMGFDTLYAVLKALVEAHETLVAQYNTLRTDYNAHVHGGITTGSSNSAAPTATSATALTQVVDVE